MDNPLLRLLIAIVVLSGLVGLFVPLTGCTVSQGPTLFYNYYCFDTADAEANAQRAPSVTHYRAADQSGWGFAQNYEPGYTDGRAAPGQGQAGYW